MQSVRENVGLRNYRKYVKDVFLFSVTLLSSWLLLAETLPELSTASYITSPIEVISCLRSSQHDKSLFYSRYNMELDTIVNYLFIYLLFALFFVN